MLPPPPPTAIPPFGLPSSQVLALEDDRLLVWQPAPDDLRWWRCHRDRQPSPVGEPIRGWLPPDGLRLALPLAEYTRLGELRLSGELDRYRAGARRLSERQRQALLHAIRGVTTRDSAEIMGCALRTVDKFREKAYARFGLAPGIAGHTSVGAALLGYGLIAILGRPPDQRGATPHSRRHLRRHLEP